MSWLTMERWSPYLVGAAIGVLSWLSFLLSDRPIGCSTAFARFSGIVEGWFRGRRFVEERPYYKLVVPKLDWDVTLVVGIVIGAFISAVLSGSFRLTWVPDLWVGTFGDARGVRLLVALGGGVLMGLGSRWAGGCTSGHGISGALQLALSSWLATACFFAGGIVTALLIYWVIGG